MKINAARYMVALGANCRIGLALLAVTVMMLQGFNVPLSASGPVSNIVQGGVYLSYNGEVVPWPAGGYGSCVVTTFDTSCIPSLLASQAACATVNKAELVAFNAFTLFGVMLIAMGAVAIIAVIVSGLSGGSFNSSGEGDEMPGNDIQGGIDANMPKVLGVVLASVMVIVGLYVFATFGASTNAIMGC